MSNGHYIHGEQEKLMEQVVEFRNYVIHLLLLGLALVNLWSKRRMIFGKCIFHFIYFNHFDHILPYQLAISIGGYESDLSNLKI